MFNPISAYIFEKKKTKTVKKSTVKISELKVKEQQIQEEIERVENTYVGTSSNINELLEEYGSTLLSGGSSLAELIRRPELNYKMLADIVTACSMQLLQLVSGCVK